ncbi:NADPH-dependent FMN reductase [Amycolatopsis sp. CA-230715]|uniref:NADPH-dependent FMN reductase n=1 Tax=Amycolatopsis sp. CA-230715 TaxID=2745196 RepID=UPI001C016FD9|nr:NADPH-dependent FMN reductase [Amycolatopsis sp. CA-230715]QWF77084.1 2-hydroxy-1,4-benzoquinone reductase [Amycolatopsis sp. CA-230715]
MTITILGIPGSLRRGSVNRRLLAAATRELPADGVHLAVWEELALVPPFDEDAEDGPAPAAVAGLRAAIDAADALLIATPEYNRSVPGQLKNALDWASRPHGDAALTGKPAAVVGASPSPGGAAGAQEQLARVLTAAGATVVGDPLPVPHAFRQFGEDDRLLDHDLRAALAAVLDRLARHVRAGAAA